MTNLGSIVENRDITLLTKVYTVKAMVFPVVMGHKEGWAQKNGSFRAVVLVKTLESPLDSKEIKQVGPKGNQPWIFIGRADAETETPILWPPDAKSWLIGKDPDAGKDWRQEEKWVIDEMVGWHHWLNGYEFEQTPGDSEGQGNLGMFSPWGCKEWDMTEELSINTGVVLGFPGGASGKKLACQFRRQGTQILSLGWKDPLEEEMTTHSSILAWRITGTAEPGGLHSRGLQRVRWT